MNIIHLLLSSGSLLSFQSIKEPIHLFLFFTVQTTEFLLKGISKASPIFTLILFMYVFYKVVIGTGVSAGMNLSETYGVAVVGEIPKG